jgi:hypothetical protein
MRPIFRRVDPDAEEQELTQEDQFNTDEVTLAENLVRESHQNSSDAPDGSSNPGRIRMAVFAGFGERWLLAGAAFRTASQKRWNRNYRHRLRYAANTDDRRLPGPRA